jgi:hypothetical protein
VEVVEANVSRRSKGYRLERSSRLRRLAIGGLLHAMSDSVILISTMVKCVVERIMFTAAELVDHTVV